MGVGAHVSIFNAVFTNDFCITSTITLLFTTQPCVNVGGDETNPARVRGRLDKAFVDFESLDVGNDQILMRDHNVLHDMLHRTDEFLRGERGGDMSSSESACDSGDEPLRRTTRPQRNVDRYFPDHNNLNRNRSRAASHSHTARAASSRLSRASDAGESIPTQPTPALREPATPHLEELSVPRCIHTEEEWVGNATMSDAEFEKSMLDLESTQAEVYAEAEHRLRALSDRAACGVCTELHSRSGDKAATSVNITVVAPSGFTLKLTEKPEWNLHHEIRD